MHFYTTLRHHWVHKKELEHIRPSILGLKESDIWRPKQGPNPKQHLQGPCRKGFCQHHWQVVAVPYRQLYNFISIHRPSSGSFPKDRNPEAPGMIFPKGVSGFRA